MGTSAEDPTQDLAEDRTGDPTQDLTPELTPDLATDLADQPDGPTDEAGEAVGPEHYELGGRPVLTVSWRRVGGRGVIEIDGELDIDAGDRLREAADELVGDAPVEAVEIDASKVEYVDSAGLRLLLDLRTELLDAGLAFRVRSVSPRFAQVVGMTGLTEQLLPED